MQQAHKALKSIIHYFFITSSWSSRQKHTHTQNHKLVAYRSMRSLNFNKNFSLSCSAILTSLSTKFFLWSGPSLFISISVCWPSDSVRMPLVMRRYVGSFSIAAHLSSCSSSSLLEDPENTSTTLLLHMLELPMRALATLSSPLSIYTSLSIYATKFWQTMYHKLSYVMNATYWMTCSWFKNEDDYDESHKWKCVMCK